MMYCSTKIIIIVLANKWALVGAQCGFEIIDAVGTLTNLISEQFVILVTEP